MRRALSIVLLLAMAACGGDGPSNGTTASGSPYPRPSSTATLTIVSPTPGQVVTGTTFTVKVKLEGARLLEQASRNITPDTGHVHIALDGTTLTMLAGLEYQMTDLKPGPHLLEASFAAADHGPFNPPVVTTVTFNVQAG